MADQKMLKWVLREVLCALPQKRDWLNPDAEREMRAMLAEPDSVAAAPAVPAVDALTRYSDSGNFIDGMIAEPRGEYVKLADVRALLATPSTAPDEQALVMPPVAAPVSQRGAGFPGIISAGEYDRHTGTMYITVKLPVAGLPGELLTIGSAALIAPADPEQAKLDSLAQAGLAAALENRAKGEQSNCAGSVAVEAFLAEDGVDGEHPSYGRGVFFTLNCMKEVYVSQPQTAPEAKSEQADNVQFLRNVVNDAAPMLRTAGRPQTADLLEVATRALEAGEQMGGAQVAKAEQPIIGKLMDDFSALPVLWGLNEPGALVRHSDVFKMLVAAGKAGATERAAAPEDRLSICSDNSFMAALDGYMDAVSADPDNRNTDRRVALRLAIFAAADAWAGVKSRAAEGKATSENLTPQGRQELDGALMDVLINCTSLSTDAIDERVPKLVALIQSEGATERKPLTDADIESLRQIGQSWLGLNGRDALDDWIEQHNGITGGGK